VQIVMDLTGDTRHEFNVGDAEAVAKAERRFKQLTGVGLYGSGSHRRGAFEAHPQFRSRRRSRLAGSKWRTAGSVASARRACTLFSVARSALEYRSRKGAKDAVASAGI
jgi:hypothetical protein